MDNIKIAKKREKDWEKGERMRIGFANWELQGGRFYKQFQTIIFCQKKTFFINFANSDTLSLIAFCATCLTKWGEEHNIKINIIIINWFWFRIMWRQNLTISYNLKKLYILLKGSLLLLFFSWKHLKNIISSKA